MSNCEHLNCNHGQTGYEQSIDEIQFESNLIFVVIYYSSFNRGT